MNDIENRVQELERIVKVQTYVIDTLKRWIASHTFAPKNMALCKLKEKFSVQYVLDHPEEFTEESLKNNGCYQL